MDDSRSRSTFEAERRGCDLGDRAAHCADLARGGQTSARRHRRGAGSAVEVGDHFEMDGGKRRAGSPEMIYTPTKIAKLLDVEEAMVLHWIATHRLYATEIAPGKWIVRELWLGHFLNEYSKCNAVAKMCPNPGDELL